MAFQATSTIPQSVTAITVTDDMVPERSVSPPTTSKIDARPHLEAGAASGRAFSISAVAQATIPMWVQTFVMISLIFGGCCSNVFALEAIVKEEPQSGHLITFAQFCLVAAEGLYYHFDRKSPTLLKPNQIPLYRWLGQIVLFFSVSMLNNYAFGFNISVPIHIILRSGGSMTTMLIGYMFGKRYSRVQVASVLILSIGIVISALGDAKSKSGSESSGAQFIAGLSVLFIAQVLSAFMGLYVESTYSKYGSNWREGLFYTHALSLFLFLPFSKAISAQFPAIINSPPLPIKSYASYLFPLPIPSLILNLYIPRQLFFLALNAFTQYLCIRGVNILVSVSSALTVTIVLNIRKLVSLLLSIWLFGNELHGQVLLGAMVVFGGGFLYGLDSQRQNKLKKMATLKAKAVAANGGKKTQ